MELYKDCQKDYDKNLEIYLSDASTEEEKDNAWKNIFIDFKTYCFNKIKKMKPFLPIDTVDDWSTNVTCNALNAILKKDYKNIEVWPKNMGAYLGMCCLGINNIKKYSREKIEIPVDFINNTEITDNEGEPLLMVENNILDEETGKWLIKEAVKMTVINDGYKMIDIDRTMRLINKHGEKLGAYSKKYTDIKNALEKNIKFILNMKENKEENK